MTTDTLSVYFQAHSHPRAVFECLRSFRYHHPEPELEITLLSDAGEDFSRVADLFGARFIYSDLNILPGGRMRGIEGVGEYLDRIHRHCLSHDSRWVILMEEDVQTLRRIRSFPTTTAAGTRMNPYSPELTRFLVSRFGPKEYGYGMCGGSIFCRESFLASYRHLPEIADCVPLDGRLAGWGDLPLTLLFHLGGHDYSVWDETSERTHPSHPILREDAALDHAFRYYYEIPEIEMTREICR